MTKEALLEIGSEELPASFIGIGMRQLKTLAEESLKASGLTFSSIETHGTPRRLAVLIHGLPDRSPDQKKVVTGPPSAIAKDAQGQWTPAALGFARKQGLKPSDLTIEKDRLSATVHIKGVGTKQLLSDLFPQWITRLEFPKSMVWEPTKFRYPRPLRWIAALYGSDLVSFSLAGVRSARWTLGLGPWAPKKIALTHAGKYAILLKNQCVLVDFAARQDAIRRYAEHAAKRAHGKVHLSTALLDQVSNLVEHPVAILGNFDAAYLELPKEVLITCLEHHQKYFPVEAASGGKLLSHFIGIRNGMSVHQDIVREGYERVLAARLADAKFFFDQDHKTKLEAKVDALKGVMFQQKLGNLFDKKERVKKLVELWSVTLAFSGEEKSRALRAADLCKADLVTGMVGEFPELQGVMSRIYAAADGEELGVAQACEQHYWPITLTSELPKTPIAALIAVADKIDTLAGDFAVGLIPTGSADPYGLRRAAVGILRILEAQFSWSLTIEDLVESAVKIQPVQQNESETISKLTQFIRQRLAATLEERGFKSDEIEAVLGVGASSLSVLIEKLKELHKFRKLPEFDALSSSFKRAANIVRQAKEKNIIFNPDDQVKEELLAEVCEKDLWAAYVKVSNEIKNIGTISYEKSLRAFIPLREPLGAFFDGVMIMVPDDNLKANRLKILYRITGLFRGIADFSKLQNA